MRAVSDGAYANLELPKVLRERRVAGRDAAFATELVYGSTRLRGLYDPIIAVAARRRLDRIDAPVLDVLRLGAHQLLGMRVPSHAALDTTVALARQVVGAGASGFVNAVLRVVDGTDRESWVNQVTAGRGAAEALAIEYSHPDWVVSVLRSALIGHGVVTAAQVDAELVDLLRADNEQPEVVLAARPGLIEVADLIRQGEKAFGSADRLLTGRFAPTAAVLSSGDPGDLPAIRDHRAAVQDEGSQLVALALAAVDLEHDPEIPRENDRPPARWLDVCAGPGGKAGLLGAIAATRGETLLANDIGEGRARLVEQSLAPIAAAYPGSVDIRLGDGRTIGQEYPGTFARVLVDAPCTGLGALRRRPEARWRRSPQDVVILASLQRDLLRAALDAAAPGGVVAYATCSPHLNETRFVVEDVVKKRTDVVVSDARPWFEAASQGRLTDLGSGPYVQLWPQRHGTDAMFCALLRKPIR